MTDKRIEDIAKVCYEANRVLCSSMGEEGQKLWEEAEEEQRKSKIEGVVLRLGNPDELTAAQKVPFDELALDEKKKYVLFQSIVNLLR